MIITELFYNDPTTGERVSEKSVQQIEPSDTINDISEHSHLTAKQIMSHLEGYFDCIFITSSSSLALYRNNIREHLGEDADPKITMAELSHFIPRTTDELCDFMKLYIPGDDILLVTKYCENDVKAAEEAIKNMCDDVHDEFSKYMNPPVSDISVTTKPEE
jgi:hypothetical protein